MWIYPVSFLSSCFLVLLITPTLRQSAINRGALDYPDERKLHRQPIPRVGGVAIAIAFFSLMVPVYVIFHSKMSQSMSHITGLSIGAGVIALLGICDDLWALSAGKKLLGQIGAALVLMPFGFVISKLSIPFVGVVDIGWQLGVVLSILWVVGLVNAVNFIDGMDGLAGGVAAVTSSALFVVSIFTGQPLMAIVCLILAGGAIGFLRYNRHPATIFMGDCGSMFLGFTLAAVSIKVLFQNPAITAGSLVPILIFALPIFDTSWAITRRLRRGTSPFKADNGHTHHRLINHGFTQRKAAWILCLTSLLVAASGVMVALMGNDKLAVITLACIPAILLVGIMILDILSPRLSALRYRNALCAEANAYPNNPQ